MVSGDSMDYKGVIQDIIDVMREDEFISGNLPETYTRKKNPEKLTKDTIFRNDLSFDSMAMIELGYSAEKRYGLENQIDDWKFLNCETIDDIAKLTCKTLGIDYPIDEIGEE